MVNKKLKFLFRGVISGIFLGYLFLKVDWSVMGNVLGTTDMNFYLGSTLLVFLGSLFLASKYYLLIKNTIISRSLFSIMKINLISRYYGLFLPSAVGPELVRWHKITRNKGGHAFFLASTIFERLTFVFLLLLSSFIPFLFFNSNLEIAQFKAQLLPFILLVLVFTVAAFSFFVFPWFQSFLREKIKQILGSNDRWNSTLSFLDNFSINNMSLSLCGLIFALSFLWHLSFLGRMFLLFLSLNLPLGFFDVVWMSSFVLLLQILPISVGGIGVREGAYAYLFTLHHLPPEQGVLIGVLFFSQELLVALLGGILEFHGSE
ncbi:MAG TPA: lysylphosphatidylglycerol synthase transmembrane domain-containing protein [Nitrospiria bacterium]|jgi:hypothetical protein